MYWLNHQPVNVLMNSKRQRVQAIGLGGIVYEWWGEKLKKEKIITTRKDLYKPEINIKAIGFVLNEMRKMPRLTKNSSKEDSMLKRYYGGNHNSYVLKIRKTMKMVLNNPSPLKNNLNTNTNTITKNKQIQKQSSKQISKQNFIKRI